MRRKWEKIPWTIQETFQKSGHQKTLPEAWRAACLLSETMVGRSSRMLRILIGARIFDQKCFWLWSKSSILELNTLIKEGHFYGKSSMYRKIALISDIHGNMTAFQAVCDDLKKQKINEVWFLGDMFSPGPGALEQWKLFKSLEPSVCVRGNWDDLLVNGYKGRLSLENRVAFFSVGRIYRDAAWFGNHWWNRTLAFASAHWRQ